MTQETIIYWEQTNTQIPHRKREYFWGTINLHANNNVIKPEMMEELPLSRKYEGILEDAEAAAEGAAVEVHTESMRPMSQPSAKK